MTRENFMRQQVAEYVRTGTMESDARRYAHEKWKTLQWERRLIAKRAIESLDEKSAKAELNRRRYA